MKKSEKLQQELEVIEGKIAILQTHAAELKRSKTEAENVELASMVRELDCHAGELKAILHAIKVGDLDYLMQHIEKAEKPA